MGELVGAPERGHYTSHGPVSEQHCFRVCSRGNIELCTSCSERVLVSSQTPVFTALGVLYQQLHANRVGL